jgi:hypothetical protein
MRISHIILAVVALVACIACVICYLVGFHAGTKQSPLTETRQGDLLIALRTYQAAKHTNWTKVQGILGMQVLALTRDYEWRFGAPTGTNRFVHQFAEAKAVANRVESELVPLSSAFTNLPVSPDFKVTIEKN